MWKAYGSECRTRTRGWKLPESMASIYAVYVATITTIYVVNDAAYARPFPTSTHSVKCVKWGILGFL